MKKVNKVKVVNHGWIGLIFFGNGVAAVVAMIYGFLSSYLIAFSFILLTVVLINIIFSIRTTNKAYLVTALHYTVCMILFMAAALGSQKLARTMYIIFFFTMFFLLFVGLSRKLKWRKREILEMAAHPISDITNGFTNRPHPVGNVPYSRAELSNFANFCLKRLISIAYEEDVRIVFVLSSNVFLHILNLKNSYTDESHISFDFEGNVSVKIIKHDYLKFKDQLSFDQLCNSLGNLFIEFLQLHKKEEEDQIIDRMNEYKFNPFFGGVIGF